MIIVAKLILIISLVAGVVAYRSNRLCLSRGESFVSAFFVALVFGMVAAVVATILFFLFFVW